MEFKRIFKNFQILIFVLIIILIILVLFRGFYQQGMCFDETYRISSLIPVFNKQAPDTHQAISEISIMGKKVPLMFKTYISTLYVLPYLPLGLFHNYLFGVRFLHLLYFLLAIVLSFLIINLNHFKIPSAFDVSGIKLKSLYSFLFILLVACSPILYPNIRIRFADCSHILALSLCYYLLLRFQETKKMNFLFFGFFTIFLEINYLAYFSWIVLALFVSALILYPKIISGLLRIRYIIIIALAAATGLFNHLYYNLISGFPAIKTFFIRFIDPEEYNRNYKIDYVQNKGIVADIIQKLRLIPGFFGTNSFIYLSIFALIMVFTGIAIYRIINKREDQENKQYLFVFLSFLFSLLFIILSPNTTRSGHYVYCMPFFELSIIAMIIMTVKMIAGHPDPRYIYSVLALFVLINLYNSNKAVRLINKTKGYGTFTPAIFEMKKTFDEKNIKPGEIIAIDWGYTGPLYFLSKGNFYINQDQVWNFIKRDYNTVKEKYCELFINLSLNRTKYPGPVYIPVYHVSTVDGTFKQFMREYNIEPDNEKVFFEYNGDTAITLYQIDHIGKYDLSYIFRHNDQNNIRNYIDFEKDSYKCAYGVYQSENKSSKWTRRESAYMLKIDKPDLLVECKLPENVQEGESNPYLKISMNDSLLENYPLKPGTNQIRIRIADELYQSLKDQVVNLHLSSNSLINAPNDTRELSFLLSGIGFK